MRGLVKPIFSRANACATLGPWRGTSATPCYDVQMTNKPVPAVPRPPLRLTPNFVDRTAERIGTVIGIAPAPAPGFRRLPSLLPLARQRTSHRHGSQDQT